MSVANGASSQFSKRFPWTWICEQIPMDECAGFTCGFHEWRTKGKYSHVKERLLGIHV